MTRACPEPTTTKLPENTWSPARLPTWSDSPVSSDSSTSSPSTASRMPSAATWSPGLSSRRSSSTTSSVATSTTSPSRTARARGAFSTARWSRVRLALTSWTMPIRVLHTSTRPNRASRQKPVASTATVSPPSRKLKGVTTLALTIWRSDRPLPWGAWLVSPRSTRSRTWAAVRPSSSPSSMEGAGEGAGEVIAAAFTVGVPGQAPEPNLDVTVERDPAAIANITTLS